MTKAPLKDIAASVRARLTQRARDRGENAQLVLTRYAIERLLYRLSLSLYRDQFILKGAMLFSLWAPTPYRATGDLDLLGYGDSAPGHLLKVFTDIITIPVAGDGVVFRPDTLRAAAARAEEQYSGVRLDFTAEIAGARLPIHVDIGFGDAVTPGTVELEYPSLLEQPPVRLHAYPPETVVAEKFQAMVELGMLNTRLKDIFDIWAISHTFPFDGDALAGAIRATFARRETKIPETSPAALTPVFADAKQDQWAAFLRRTEIALAPVPFPEIQVQIAEFVMPPARALRRDEPFNARWASGGPWR